MNERITKQDVLAYKREILEQTVLVAPAEAAMILSCSERSVLNLVREGDLSAYRRTVGTRGIKLLASELREYVKSIKIDNDLWRE